VATRTTISENGGARRENARRPPALAWLCLFLFPTLALAQSAAAGSDDLAVQASSARERNDVPTAIQLYKDSVQLKPDWPEGW